MVQFEEYDVQAHYNSLKSLEEASNDFDTGKIGYIIDTDIRSIFLRHGVQKTVGVTLLHKHFSLSNADKMVNYGVVSYPWDMASASSSVKQDIHPTSWRFTRAGGIAPYEFSYELGGPENPGLGHEDIAKFLQELQEVLRNQGLTDLLGLRWLDAGTAEPGIELTSGTANVTFPHEVFSNDQGRNVEAHWIFENGLGAAPGVTISPKRCMQTCVMVHGRHQRRHKHVS